MKTALAVLLMMGFLSGCGGAAVFSAPNGWTQTSFGVERYDYRINGVRRAWVAQGFTSCTAFVWGVDSNGRTDEESLGDFISCQAAKAATEKHFAEPR